MNHKHEAHHRIGIVISHRHLIAMLWVVVSGIAFSVHAHAGGTEGINYVSWIENCSPNPVSLVDEGLIVYITEVGAESGDVIDCLNIRGNPDLGDGAFAVFPSPIDTVIDMESGEESPMPTALFRSGNKLLVAAGTNSDRGVTEVQYMSDDIFIVSASQMTHTRNYLVFGNTGSVRYLTNGDVKIVNGNIISYGFKTYFYKDGGAIWLDTLIDLEGNILDIVTSDTGEHVSCISRDALIRKTRLDLSRVEDHMVCYEH